MPRATANTKETVRKELKTLPEGWVELRRLEYGEFLSRRQMSSAMKISGGKGNEFMGEMDLANQAAIEFEFAHCIVDHNLEDENGRQLDFRKPRDIKRLDPKIGQEIGEYIDEMNQLLDDEEDLAQESEEQSSEDNQMTH